jgi:hypothetical protein
MKSEEKKKILNFESSILLNMKDSNGSARY